jgi:NAD-dependent DNA ligase
LARAHAQAQSQWTEVNARIKACGLNGLGPVVARDVMDYFASARGRHLVQEMSNLNLNPQGSAPRQPSASVTAP